MYPISDKFPRKPKRVPQKAQYRDIQKYPWISKLIFWYSSYPDISVWSKFPDGWAAAEAAASPTAPAAAVDELSIIVNCTAGPQFPSPR